MQNLETSNNGMSRGKQYKEFITTLGANFKIIKELAAQKPGAMEQYSNIEENLRGTLEAAMQSLRDTKRNIQSIVEGINKARVQPQKTPESKLVLEAALKKLGASLENLYIAHNKKISEGLTEVRKDKKESTDEISDKMVSSIINESIRLLNSFYLNKTKLHMPIDKTMKAQDVHVASVRTDLAGIFYRRSNVAVKVNKEENAYNKLGEKVQDIVPVEKSFNIGGAEANYGYNEFRVPAETVSMKASEKIIPVTNNLMSTKLVDCILTHKNAAVKVLVQITRNEKYKCFTVGEEQVKAEYPCLMIDFSDYVWTKHSGGLLPGYAEFAAHLLIASINAALRESKIEPFIERRSSFGFLTPTITDVYSGLRLSLGLVPNREWLEAVKRGVATCDDILDKIKSHQGSHNYVAFDTETKIESVKSLSGIMSTIGYRLIEEIISPGRCEPVKNLVALASVEDQGLKDEINKRGENAKEDFEQLVLTESERNFETKTDKSYFEIYNECMRVYQQCLKSLEETDEVTLLEGLKIDISKATHHLIETQDKIVMSSLATARSSQFDIDDTSDDEGDDNGHPESRLQFFTPAGTGALFAAAVAQYNSKCAPETNTRYSYDLYTYYEVSSSWKNILDVKGNGKKYVCVNEETASKLILFKLDDEIKLPTGLVFGKTLVDWHNMLFNWLIDKTKTKGIDCLSSDKRKQRALRDSLISKMKAELCLGPDSPEKKSFMNTITSVYLNDYSKILLSEGISSPTIYYADINPCINKKQSSRSAYKSFQEILSELTGTTPPPKVLVIDTTSTTAEQLKKIINLFDEQDKIPVLITAASLTKHYQLGLDFYLLGKNTVYFSKNAKTQHQVFNERYVEELKKFTKGTEATLSRVSRRTLTNAINTVAQSPSSLFYHADNGKKLRDTIDEFTFKLLSAIEERIRSGSTTGSAFVDKVVAQGEAKGTQLQIYYHTFEDDFKDRLKTLLNSDDYSGLSKSDLEDGGYAFLGELVLRTNRLGV